MQKVNNCFNRKRQEHAREKVFDVKDGQVQKSDGRPGVSDHARVGGGEAREMGGHTGWICTQASFNCYRSTALGVYV